MSDSKFEAGTRVAVSTSGGKEIEVIFVRYTSMGHADVETDDGRTNSVTLDRLMPLKGPFFDVRGQVATTSASHAGEVGEIVTLGKTASGKRAFEVLFEGDQNTEWFTEDQVFLEDRPEDEFIRYTPLRSV